MFQLERKALYKYIKFELLQKDVYFIVTSQMSFKIIFQISVHIHTDTRKGNLLYFKFYIFRIISENSFHGQRK